MGSGISKDSSLDWDSGAVAARRDLAETLEADIRANALDAHALWTATNKWMNVEDSARAGALIDWGVSVAGLARDCNTLACVWACHWPDDHPGIDRILSKAEALAATAEAWWEIAEDRQKFLKDADGIRRCLEAAAACELTEDWSYRIGRGFDGWLDDEDAASRFNSGEWPKDLGTSSRRLKGWDADAGGLFNWLRTQVGPEEIAAIANANYGSDCDGHYLAITALLKSGRIPRTLPYIPVETLELAHWGREPTLARTFACSVLALSHVETESGCPSSTAAPLLEGCRALGPEALAHLRDFLVWQVITMREHHGVERCFALFVLLLTQCLLDPKDPRLGPLAEQVLALAAAEMKQLADRDSEPPRPERGWLRRLTHSSAWDDLFGYATLGILESLEPELQTPLSAILAHAQAWRKT